LFKFEFELVINFAVSAKFRLILLNELLWILDDVRAGTIVIINDGRRAIFAIINDLSCKSNAPTQSYKGNHNRAIDKFKNLERVALRIAA